MLKTIALILLALSFALPTSCKKTSDSATLDETSTETSEWHSLPHEATRFPYYDFEREPRNSRACHDDWNAYGEEGTLFFIAVADSSTSPILWDQGLERCQCQDGSQNCGGPSCEQDMCGRKIKIRCTSDECLPKYRNKPIVVMIRDVCPVRHAINRSSGHCQGGDHIDIYRDFYRLLTNKGTSGRNLSLEFAEASQDAPLGFEQEASVGSIGAPEATTTEPSEPATENLAPLEEVKVGDYTCQEQKDFGKCDEDWMTPVCDHVCDR